MDLVTDESSVEHCVFLMAEVCPLGCGKRIMGKRMEEHCRSVCSRRLMLCPHGCGNCVMGNNLAKHEETCPMKKIFARADSAVANIKIGELNRSLGDLYESKSQIRKNLATWSRVPLKGGWGSEESADKIARLLRAQNALQTKMRSKTED